MKPKFTLLAILVFFANILHSQNINTVIGGLGDNGQATAAELYQPNGVAVDKFGNIYIVDAGNLLIRKVSTSGIITILAGIADNGYTGGGPFGSPAILSSIGNPASIAVDTSGNTFIGDILNNNIMKVNANGIISLVTHSGLVGEPYGLAIDKSGNIYEANFSGNKVNKISPSGTVTTVAGTGTAGFAGDTHTATTAKLNQPTGVCVDKFGNLFISDQGNNRIRKVDTSGIITTIAGIGSVGYAGDGGPATIADFNVVAGISVDTAGNIYVADNHNNEIRKISATGIVTKVAGIALSGGYTGDGAAATAAQLYYPTATACDQSGNIYISDYTNNRIRKINSSGIISTVAGSNYSTSIGNKGDGGPAVSALLNAPAAVFFGASGNMYISDISNHTVRAVNSAGIISTIAGNDTIGNSGDGGPATNAELNSPTSMAMDKKGNLFICDNYSNVVRKVNSSGIISTYAGYPFSGGYSGDGHRADSTSLNEPVGVAADKQGNIYIAERGNYKIRKVDTNHIITTVAGNGSLGYFGDGGAATSAEFSYVEGVLTDDTGNLYIPDYSNNCVRKVDTSGIITTMVSGLSQPDGITRDKQGNFYVSGGNYIIKINSSGTSTYGGNGSNTFYGDGGPAILADISTDFFPSGIAADTVGNLFIPAMIENRIREIYRASITISTPHDSICSGIGTFTFTATASAAPEYSLYYHWMKNNIPVGTNSPVYVSAGVDSGDVIVCYVTNGPSGTNIATSNLITMVILHPATPSVSITSSPSYFCSGDSTTITAHPVNGGSAPIYDWYKNGIHAHTGNPYTTHIFTGDIVYCKLTSNAYCLVYDTVFSSYAVFSILVPTVSVSTIPGTQVCIGTTVNCTANPTSGGPSPKYDWFRNGALVDSGSIYSFIPDSADVVYCKLTNIHFCLATDTVVSSNDTFIVHLPSYPSVSIIDSNGPVFCPGTTAYCTASPLLGGTSPVIFWYKNGSYSFTGNPYSFMPANSDVVHCQIFSNATCLLSDIAYSPNDTFTALIPDTASVAILFNTGDTVCAGTQITCIPIPVNGGPTPKFDWYVNWREKQIADTFSFQPNNGDYIFCFMTNNSACLAANPVTSPTTYFTVNRPAHPSVAIVDSPGQIVCTGTTVELTANNTNGGTAPLYNWYVNGNMADTGSVFDFIPNDGDNVYCLITSNASCLYTTNAFSQEIVFNVDSTPKVSITSTPGPVIFSGDDVVFSASVTAGNGISFEYQWMKNGIAIPGATSAIYATSSFDLWDSVYCIVTADNICQGAYTSNSLFISTYHGMSVYPNPSDGNFVINGNDENANGDDVDIRVYNMAGKLVYQQNSAFNVITFHTSISLPRELPPDEYMLRLHYNKTRIAIPLTIKY